MSLEFDGNVDGDGLLVVNCKEIDVQAVVFDGMELELVKNYGVVGLAVELEVDDERIGSLDEALDFTLRNCEEYILDTGSVKIAGDESLCAESLDALMVALLPT